MEAAGKSLSLLELTMQGWGEEWGDSQEGVCAAAKAMSVR